MDKQQVRMLLILSLQHFLHGTNLRLQLMFRSSTVPVCQIAFSAQTNAFHTGHSCWRANHNRCCPCVPGTICHRGLGCHVWQCDTRCHTGSAWEKQCCSSQKFACMPSVPRCCWDQPKRDSITCVLGLKCMLTDNKHLPILEAAESEGIEFLA